MNSMKLFRLALRWSSAVVLLGAVFLLVVGLWLAWMFWGVGFVNDAICTGNVDCGKMGQIGDLFGGVNALFAGLAFAGLVISLELTRRANALERGWERDKQLADQAIAAYGWAYDALVDKAAPIGIEKRPVRDRFAWLTGARHLLRAEKLAMQIDSEALLLIHDERKEYWRTQFYELFAKRLPFNFFADIDPHLGADPYIEASSALVISRFIDGQGWRDPLDDLDMEALVEAEGWGAPPLSRSIEKYVMRVHPGFVDRLVDRFPKGRVAKARADLAEATEKRYKEMQQK